MTKQELFNLYNKFQTDWEGKHDEVVGNGTTDKWQCFDTVVRWCMYLGLPKTIFAGLSVAWQIWYPSTAEAVKNFDFIENTPDAVPQKGDIVVWEGDYNGGAGHTGVATGRADLNSLDVFNQNDPIGSVNNVDLYTYEHIVGWLRYKFVTDSPVVIPPEIQKLASMCERIVRAREGAQEDPKTWTDEQEKAFTERMVREMNRAVQYDKTVLAAFGSGVDSNTKTSEQVVAKLKTETDVKFNKVKDFVNSL